MYRRKLRHSRVKNLYKFASAKNHNVLTVESSLEFDACFHFEYSDDVVSYEAQPAGFYYCYEAKTLPYTPDFRLVNSSGSATLVEIKPASIFSKSDVKQRLLAKRQAARVQGLNLILVTDRQIRVKPMLDNLKLLHRYSGLASMTTCHYLVLDVIRKSGVIKVQSVLEKISADEGEVMCSILSLLQLRVIKANLDLETLGRDTTIWC